MNQDEWDLAAGPNCADCGAEALRIIDGLCLECHFALETRKEAEAAEKTDKRYFKQALEKGTISLADLKRGRR